MGNVTKKGDTTLVIQGCILSYPHLFEARAASADAKPKYSANLILPKLTEEDNAVFGGMINQVISQRWPQGAPANLNMPWKDAGAKAPQFAGRLAINCSAVTQPPVVHKDGATPAGPEDVYAGMGVNAYVGCFTYDTQLNKGVSFGLNAIQIADATLPRLDGRLAPQHVFTPIGETAAPAASPVMPAGAVPVGAPAVGAPQPLTPTPHQPGPAVPPNSGGGGPLS